MHLCEEGIVMLSFGYHSYDVAYLVGQFLEFLSVWFCSLSWNYIESITLYLD